MKQPSQKLVRDYCRERGFKVAFDAMGATISGRGSNVPCASRQEAMNTAQYLARRA